MAFPLCSYNPVLKSSSSLESVKIILWFEIKNITLCEAVNFSLPQPEFISYVANISIARDIVYVYTL